MLCYEFPPLGGGGAYVVSGLSRQLVRLGHEVDLVTMGFSGLAREETMDGVHLIRVPCRRRKPEHCTLPEAARYLFAALPVVWRLARHRRYDLNHTHFIFPDGLIAWLMCRVFGLPYLVTAHGSDVPGYNPHRFKWAHLLLRPFWRAVIRQAVFVVSPSQMLQVLITRCAPNRQVALIANGIDAKRLSADKEKRWRVLMVTRMVERKGVQFALEAFASIAGDYEINIVGDGPYLPTLQAQAQALGLHVRFWGWLDNQAPALKELYETSRIFILPSEVENFPVSILEAMAAGLAIITTASTGCAEVVGDAAVLVPPKNGPAVAQALRALLDDPARCAELGRAARVRLERCFSWQSVSQQYLALYERCVLPEGASASGVEVINVSAASKPADGHRVSVVVPTLGRQSLQEALHALKTQTRPPDEIIVVRDERRRGAAWGRNEGIRRAGGDLIALTDDDCIVASDWLARLIGALDTHDAAAAGGAIHEEDTFLQAVRSKRRTMPQQEQRDTAGWVGSGWGTLYRRSWLETCVREDGYVFNEAFKNSEDWELAWRLRRRAATFIFVPALVTHRRRSNWSDYLQIQFTRGVSIAMLFRLQRSMKTELPVHDSLLWGAQGQAHRPKWALALWRKLIGPFNGSRFVCRSHFWRFWFGEKVQAAGFFWEMICRHPLRPAGVGAGPEEGRQCR